MEQLLAIENVSRRYGSVQALRDVTVTLAPGTIGLVGNNGAGKSTLLKILLGLLAPTSGRGTILGHDIGSASRQLRGEIGYMAESAAVVPALKGVEFVALSGELYGMPPRDAKRRAHEVLNYVGLGEMRYRRLEEYSTGNQQRLKLAAALVHDPRLLLLDEPTGGLDPPGRLAMLRLLEDLIAETGKSVVLCTHLLSDVERLCTQVVVLHQGSIVRSGDINELRQIAPNRFELAWQGAGEGFLSALDQAGIQISMQPDSARAMALLPAGASTAVLFELARAADVVLTHLRPDHEDLERMFFRVTDNSTRASA